MFSGDPTGVLMFFTLSNIMLLVLETCGIPVSEGLLGHSSWSYDPLGSCKTPLEAGDSPLVDHAEIRSQIGLKIESLARPGAAQWCKPRNIYRMVT